MQYLVSPKSQGPPSGYSMISKKSYNKFKTNLDGVAALITDPKAPPLSNTKCDMCCSDQEQTFFTKLALWDNSVYYPPSLSVCIGNSKHSLPEVKKSSGQRAYR